jgi:hypothetical protein
MTKSISGHMVARTSQCAGMLEAGSAATEVEDVVIIGLPKVMSVNVSFIRSNQDRGAAAITTLPYPTKRKHAISITLITKFVIIFIDVSSLME